MPQELINTTALSPYDLDHDPDDAGGARFIAFDGSTESKWFYRKGEALPKDAQWLVMGMRKEILRWGDDKKIIERITKTPGVVFPSVDSLNAGVPENEWPENPFGPPKGPYVLNFVVALANPTTGERVISSNATYGQKAAYTDLKSRFQFMRAVRGGANIAPIVKLSHAMMPTSFGPKARPHFDVIEWRDLGGSVPAVAPAPVQGLPGVAVAKPTPSEIVDDVIDDKSPPPKVAKVATVVPKYTANPSDAIPFVLTAALLLPFAMLIAERIA